jgi:predicted secreted protein
MANVVNGRNVVLYKLNDDLTSTAFAYATEASLSIQTEVKEVTNQSSAFYREFKPDVISWGIAGSGFVILNTEYNYISLAALIADREAFTVQFVIDNGGALGLSIFSGSVIITGYELSGTNDSLASYAVKLQGTGAYSTSGTVVTPSGTIIISGTTLQVFQVTAAGGETSITFPGTIGLDCLYASRGGTTVQPLAYVSTPTAPNGAVWQTTTGVLDLANAAVAGELFLILAQ